MSTVTIDVTSSKTSRINLGLQGENIVEHVVFNISQWIEDYGEGVAFIYAKRRGDDEPYPVALTMDMDEKTATWDLTAVDTAAKGKGSAQLVYVVDEDDDNDLSEDEVKKTKVYATTVQSSLVPTSEENPDAYETWLEVLGGYTTRIEAAAISANSAKDAAVLAKIAAETAQGLAEAARDSSGSYATLARSYAKGDTESRSGEATDNADYYRGQAASSAIAAAGSATSAGLSKLDAEAYAIGKRSGVDVGDSDPTYHNNAKYYAGEASDSATAAETAQGKAEDAQGYAETAQDKAEDAQEAAETAQGKAEDAQEAAETAQGKAEDAQDAAEYAQGKAEDAQDAAEDARDDAVTAKNSAQTYEQKIENMTASAETGAAGSSATATKSETPTGFNIHFKVPKGDTGKGLTGYATITEEYHLILYFDDGTQWESEQSIRGPMGSAENLGLIVINGELCCNYIE